ncbi:hypothetical protein GQ54DRAFT_68833 [Martensiomyces pterosporus]|nr:hypothetical protein GQ54DRAFT_68833 [Martensiomyces pterosporus]
MPLLVPHMANSHAFCAQPSKRRHSDDRDDSDDSDDEGGCLLAGGGKGDAAGQQLALSSDMASQGPAKRPAAGLQAISDRLRSLDLISRSHATAAPIEAPQHRNPIPSAQSACTNGTAKRKEKSSGDWEMGCASGADAAPTKRPRVAGDMSTGCKTEEIECAEGEGEGALPRFSVIHLPLSVRARAFLGDSDDNRRERSDGPQNPKSQKGQGQGQQEQAPTNQAMVLYRPPISHAQISEPPAATDQVTSQQPPPPSDDAMSVD